ncbi:MAG: hypothetical protein M3Z04_15125, partial [Chloroflexota bacterium]|nr:hypothetical protein [Chloroflexota bacterium]
MSADDQLYHGFACPQEPFDYEFLEVVATGYARALCELFLNRFGPAIDAAGAGLTSLLRTGLAADASFEMVWNLAFGEIKRTLMVPAQSDVLYAATALGLHLNCWRQAGIWQQNLRVPTRLRWGHWLLPTADWLAVSYSDVEARIRSRHGRADSETVFSYSGNSWTSEGVEELPQIRTPHRTLDLLRGDLLETSAFDGIRPDLAVDLSAAALTDAIRRAFDLLSCYAGPYLRWVENVICGIIPVRSEAGSYKSGTNEYRPGVISISFPCPDIVLGELLVHEATHQYFYLLSRVGEIDDGSDTT